MMLQWRGSQQLFYRDRQIAYALVGRVGDSGGDRPRDRTGRQLPEALCAERTRFLVEVTHEDGIQLRDIGISRHQIAGVVAVEEAAGCWVGFRLLEQCLPNTPGDAADRLASRGLGVDDAAGVIGPKGAAET